MPAPPSTTAGTVPSHAAVSPDSYEKYGRMGLPVLSSVRTAPLERVRQLLDTHRAAMRASGNCAPGKSQKSVDDERQGQHDQRIEFESGDGMKMQELIESSR